MIWKVLIHHKTEKPTNLEVNVTVVKTFATQPLELPQRIISPVIYTRVLCDFRSLKYYPSIKEIQTRYNQCLCRYVCLCGWFVFTATIVGYLMPNLFYTHIFNTFCISSSSSSCRTASTDITDPLSPLLPIVHRLR